MDTTEKRLLAAVKSAMQACDDFWAEHYWAELRWYQKYVKVHTMEVVK